MSTWRTTLDQDTRETLSSHSLSEEASRANFASAANGRMFPPCYESIQVPSASNVPASVAIGRTFKRWRDEKRLSLREVEEASRSLPEPVGFEYLSKLERGLVMPSVGKLATLAAIYGRPVYELIDIYETVRMRALAPAQGSYASFRRLGQEKLKQGELSAAIGCFLAAVERAEGAAKPKPSRIAEAYTDVGRALVEGGRHVTGRNYFKNALRNAQSPVLQGRLLGELAITHQRAGDTLLAEILAKKGLDLSEDHEATRARAYAVLARILLDQGRLKEAEDPLRVSVAGLLVSGDVDEAVQEIANLGLCLVMLGKKTEGFRCFSDAVKRAGERGRPRLRAATLSVQGKALYLAGRRDEAMGPLLDALRIARDHDLREEGFRSAIYLWRIAGERKARTDEKEYFEVARKLRGRVMAPGEEVAYFDANAPNIRRRQFRGPRRPRRH